MCMIIISVIFDFVSEKYEHGYSPRPYDLRNITLTREILVSFVGNSHCLIIHLSYIAYCEGSCVAMHQEHFLN